MLAHGAEPITTLFSYLPTEADMSWEDCTPIFAYIYPEDITIGVTEIQSRSGHLVEMPASINTSRECNIVV